MENFSVILDNAIKRIEYMDNNIKYPFSLLYPFTTENINGYINLFNLENRSLLTVGSSLDQAFNAILYNPSNITVLDINPYIKYYYYLKLASIIRLPFDEYCDFLRYKDFPKNFTYNCSALNIKTFNKIKDVLRILDYESYLFWDELIQQYSGMVVRRMLFIEDENTSDVINKCNPYMNSKSKYNELKKKVLNTKVSFINDDVFDASLNQHYDNIWFSNIGTYLDTREELYQLLEKYKNYLNKNGILLLSYLYNTPCEVGYKKDWAPVYDLENLFKETSDLELQSFTGVKGLLFKDDSIKDSILTYRKK